MLPMQTEEGASAAQTPEQRQRRNMDRYLDRPSLIGMLFILAVCCCILALLVDKVATSRASDGSAWGVGLAIGAGLAAADGCAIGMWWRASATRRRRRSMQARLGLPGLPRAKEPAWRFMVPFFALLVGPATAAFGAASYLLGHGSFPGVRHPRTLFEISSLTFAAAVFACFVGLIAWFTAWPYYGLGLRGWRRARRGSGGDG